MTRVQRSRCSWTASRSPRKATDCKESRTAMMAGLPASVSTAPTSTRPDIAGADYAKSVGGGGPMSTLTLVRHAQASLFAENYDVLSSLGETQARLLGEFSARRKVDFDEVYCGPRTRQRQT